jgi:adenosylmethionine-8-amino-7-oxononanoate aminotransferase
VAPLPGYFQAIKAVCDRHGALLIFDEVMCGMGRTGTLHAWEQEGVVPDIEAVGKVLGSGYAPISAMLVGYRVMSALRDGSGYFAHGQTYQSLPLNCAAALEVQSIIQNDNLLANVGKMGTYLGRLLQERLADHPYVGDIRGRGLFWAVEFVADKLTKEPLDTKLNVAARLGKKGLEWGYDISLFPATGSANGWKGGHFLLAPPNIVRKSDVEEIVERVMRVVNAVFKDLEEYLYVESEYIEKLAALDS